MSILPAQGILKGRETQGQVDLVQLQGGVISFPGRIFAHEGDDPGGEAGVQRLQGRHHLVVGEVADLDGVIGALGGADAAPLAGQFVDDGPVVPGDGPMGADAVAGEAQDAAAPVDDRPPFGGRGRAPAQELLDFHDGGVGFGQGLVQVHEPPPRPRPRKCPGGW